MKVASLVTVLTPPRVRPTADAEDRSEVAAQASRFPWTPIVLAGAVAVAAYAVIQLWFINAQPGLDDQGLFNPIYIFTHTGRMIYPIYPFPGSTDAYFVHPPGDAVVVGA